MSLQRIFRWECDDCKKTVEHTSYGAPQGWVYIKVMSGVLTHRCESCKTKIPKNLVGDCQTIQLTI